ncbi:MAG: protein translocase subunit SecF [Actinomycetes bacterium]|jgi:preprotein translocase subunit SecF|nr:MAG: protein translocase subunit SecF [Actinomycetota bacterium]
MAGLADRLRGDGPDLDILGRRRLWYGLSLALLVLSLAGLLGRGLNLGVEFTGGSVFTFTSASATVERVREAAAGAIRGSGDGQVIVQRTGAHGWRVTTGLTSGDRQSDERVEHVRRAIAERLGLPPGEIGVQVIGASWGGRVTERAALGLAVLLAAVIGYLSFAFEWRMALAAVAALGHDLVVTAGVYAWTGFEVTPATLLGFLTILGYSLYDAVVVFDMIKEVTARLGSTGKMTYTQAANRALNATLVRSLNTTLVAILPVASILFIGTTLLGAGTLRDLSLALFVGMIVGTYSSLCVATPLLAALKEREPRYAALARRVAGRDRALAGAGRSAGPATTAHKRRKRQS